MGSEKYPTNRAIAPGVGNMSGIGGVLASREVNFVLRQRYRNFVCIAVQS